MEHSPNSLPDAFFPHEAKFGDQKELTMQFFFRLDTKLAVCTVEVRQGAEKTRTRCSEKRQTQ